VSAPTPAVAALLRAGVVHQVHRYEHDAAVASYGLEAAEALGVDGSRVFKTLVADAGSRLVVAVVPVEALLDLKVLAAAMGAKSADMADPTAAERATGYVVGGISPVGQKRSLPTVVDERAAVWPTVFVSGGRRGLEIELAPDDLLAVTQARLAPIARAR
jgi:Cys-tRNA(Pro)/Cys-tRNA(Cys) deacylase